VSKSIWYRNKSNQTIIKNVIDKILRKAYEQGILLTGLSAGAICWFEQGITDPENGDLYVLNGLGFLAGSSCPHYDGENRRKPAYKKLVLTGKAKSGYAIDDGVGLHFINNKLYKAVSSRKRAKAFYVQNMDGVFQEDMLDVQYITKPITDRIKTSL